MGVFVAEPGAEHHLVEAHGVLPVDGADGGVVLELEILGAVADVVEVVLRVVVAQDALDAEVEGVDAQLARVVALDGVLKEFEVVVGDIGGVREGEVDTVEVISVAGGILVGVREQVGEGEFLAGAVGIVLIVERGVEVDVTVLAIEDVGAV